MRRVVYGSLLALPMLLAACSNPADNKPVAQVGEAQPEAAAPAAPVAPAPEAAAPAATTEQLLITPADSKVEFKGSKVTGSHDGGFKQFSGTIDLVGGRPETSKVSIDIDTASLWTDTEKLTGHLQSPDFFDVAKFPKATFTSTQIAPRGEGGQNAYTVTGNLDLHGVQKSITFPAEIEVNQDNAKVKAEFVLMRKDFGIVYPGKPNDLIRDEVVVKLDIKAPRGAGAAPAPGPGAGAPATGMAPAGTDTTGAAAPNAAPNAPAHP